MENVSVNVKESAYDMDLLEGLQPWITYKC